MITKKQLNKAKVKVHFKSWALSVKKSTGLSFKIPEELIESLSPELDKYVENALLDLGLIKEPDSFRWTGK